ncbi:MAG: hypothetical protein D6744_10520 [Planctomycetota bacterium]|nr:MAG: hypothetical protein D6744_10520 [Planctomycetota bacterium]
MWFKKDDFHFAWKKMSGDFILTAQFEFVGEGVEPHRKVGWMVRSSLETNSAYADAVVHGDGLTSLQFRRERDADTEEVAAEIKTPDVLQLEKAGNRYIMRAAKFGEPLMTTGEVELSLGDSLYVGLAICSHNDTTYEEAIVRNVRIEVPAPADFRPYQDFGGSRLEILDVASGHRKIVYETDGNLEAPNWTRDGKALIVGAFAVWRIDDPLKFYVRVPNEADAENELRKRLNEVRSTVIGQHNMNEFFNLDRTQVDANWSQIEKQMLDAVRPGVLADYGVDIQHVGIRRVALPSEVTAKVQTSMQEEWKAQANTLREEGKGLAAAIKAQAEADRDKILAFARRRAQEIESQGVEASARIMHQIAEEDSEFYIWLQYLEALKEAFSQRGTIFLDAQDVIYPFFSDPLLPLREGGAGRLAPAIGNTPASAPAE